ncbi:uncharacterized protein LOC62_02G002568 [Vanrija pseudolonga]|uniref:F-box domain-containing protein n=1 Tax=Vanrija pseudolonga TaxID=143232 RepID=A0AAF1BG15_9TREE|nr:hypothetical protein LOC62_02G002568 [Vanrija pseudolonga]
MSDTASPRPRKRRRVSASPAPGITLDDTAFPHILDQVLTYASLPTLYTLRLVSRSVQTRVDTLLYTHVRLSLSAQDEDADGEPYGVVMSGLDAKLPGFWPRTSQWWSFAVGLTRPEDSHTEPARDVVADITPPQRRAQLARWSGALAHVRTLDAETGGIAAGWIALHVPRLRTLRVFSDEKGVYPSRLPSAHTLVIFPPSQPSLETTNGPSYAPRTRHKAARTLPLGAKRVVYHVKFPVAPDPLLVWSWPEGYIADEEVFVFSDSAPNIVPGEFFVCQAVMRHGVSRRFPKLAAEVARRIRRGVKVTLVDYDLIDGIWLQFEPGSMRRQLLDCIGELLAQEEEGKEADLVLPVPAGAVDELLHFVSGEEWRAGLSDEDAALFAVPERATALLERVREKNHAEDKLSSMIINTLRHEIPGPHPFDD